MTPRTTPATVRPTHDPATCRGCRLPLFIADLEVVFGKTRNTLYKWSRKGYPYFPKASRLPSRVLLVRCQDAQRWLEERAR